MQENKFEKKVQQQMEELSFRPSATVWTRVEEELDKRRRRRRLVYVSIAAALLITAGLGGYHVLSTSKNELASTTDKNDSQKNTANTKNRTEAGTVSVPEKNTPPPGANEEANTTNDKAANGGTAPLDNDDVIAKKATVLPQEKAGEQKQVAAQKNKVEQKRPVVVKNKQTDLYQDNERVTTKKQSGTKGKNDKGVTDLLAKENTGKQPMGNESKTSNELLNKQPDSTITNTSSTVAAPMEEDAKQDMASHLSPDSVREEAMMEEASLVRAAKRITRKLRIGVEVSGGMSKMDNKPLGLLDVMKTEVMDYAMNPGYSNNAFIYPASPIQAGAAFNAGVSLALPVSKRSTVLSGLYYQYRSTQTTIGYFVNMMATVSNGQMQSNTVSGYYRARQTSSYTNRYHFIEVPLTYQWQMNKGKKTPLTLDMGLSANYLLSTNAVRYDTTQGGIYYKNKEGFNRLNFSLNTGLMMSLKRKGEVKWSAGPVLSFQLKEVSKDVLYREEYLFYGGFRLRMFL